MCTAIVTAILITGPGAAAALRTAPDAGDAAAKRLSAKTSYDQAFALAIQPNGRIVVAGNSSCQHDGCTFWWSGFVLARYLPNGRLDPSFGRGGRVLTDVGGIGDAYAVAIQQDGKILVAGEGASSSTLVRYTPRGRLDPTFGRGGFADTDFQEECIPVLHALALQSDGSIVVAGDCESGKNDEGGGADGFVVARYTLDGRLDPSFGEGGSVVTDFGPDRWTGTFGSSVAIRPDGKIVVAGSETDDVEVYAVALARYMPDGQLDASFGTGGKVLDVVDAGEALANYIALQPDGKIVAAGERIVRYRPDGSRDPSFGDEGQVPTALAFITGIFLQHDSTIVVAGGMKGGALGVARYLPDGDPDPGFGRGGSVATDFGRSSDAWASDLAAQRDGKIVTAGTKEPSGGWPDFALARHTGQGRLDRGFGNAGRVTTDFPSGVTGFESFTATRSKHGVLIRWRTSFEVETQGFHICRERPGKPLLRVSRKLIVARGNSARGAAYRLLDRRSAKGTGRYLLQEVKRDGRTINRGQATVRKAG